MALHYYVARMTADQALPVAGDHLEFNLEGGVGNIATVSTGAGQASGIFTVNTPGTYLIRFGVRASASNGAILAAIYDDVTGADLLDDCGVRLELYTDDNRATTDLCEFATVQSVYTLAVNDRFRIEVTADISLLNIYEDGTFLQMLRLL